MTDSILLPRILLTNDDGFDAPGLAALAEIAAPFAQEIWIVAPQEDQSGASQKISLRAPLQATCRGQRRWAVTGTPSDCVALALDHFMKDAAPSLVLSGVNATCNVGEENNLSGTVGAALTALMLGVPAIAVSQDGPSRADIPWETTRAILPLVLKHLLAEGWKKETALCVNLPALPPEKITGLRWTRGARKNIAKVKSSRRVSPRGEEYFWLALEDEARPVLAPDSDMAALKRGEVSVTILSPDRSFETARPFFSFAEEPPDDDE